MFNFRYETWRNLTHHKTSDRSPRLLLVQVNQTLGLYTGSGIYPGSSFYFTVQISLTCCVITGGHIFDLKLLHIVFVASWGSAPNAAGELAMLPQTP